ncbi:hypothetical protein QAC21B_00333 [Acinetobacter bohemicus]|nr:hypothetical protein QAC21B_00333 [Acinetobacter bohemicus]
MTGCLISKKEPKGSFLLAQYQQTFFNKGG